MRTIRDWLALPLSEVEAKLLASLPALDLLSSPPTKLELIAALAGMDTGGYGVIASGGPYGLTGLLDTQAYAWWELRAFIDGVLFATDEAHIDVLWLKDELAKEHARVRALLDERRRAPTEAPPEAP